MPQWMVDLFGASLAPIVWVALVAAMVCILAIVVILVAKRLFANGATLGPRMRAPRLQVVDVARVDDKRKLVLVRRDDVEHLVLVGGQTDILVEASIARATTAPRPTRSEDGRLDIPAMSPGASPPVRREPAAPPLTASLQDEGFEASATERVPAPSGRWPQASAPADHPASAIPAEPRQVPAPRARAETVTPPNRRPSDAFPTAEPARRDGNGNASFAETKAVEPRQSAPIRQPAPVPSVEAPLKPTEPPALNPSTMPFSRATPTLRSKAEIDSIEPQTRPQNEIEPKLAIPGAATKPAATSQNGDAGEPPAVEAPKRDPAPRGLPAGLGTARQAPSDAPAKPRTATPAAASAAEEGRPLSVRSFASAIQARRYGRTDAPPRAPAGASTPPSPSARATERKTTAESREAAGRSIEDFLSADLTEELSRDIDAAFSEPALSPAAPAAPVAPRPAPAPAAPRPATAPPRASEATGGPANTATAAKPATAGGERADAVDAPAGPKAPPRENDPQPAPQPRAPAASDQGKATAAPAPTSAPASSGERPAPTAAASGRPAPQPQTVSAATPERKLPASPAPAPADASAPGTNTTAAGERTPPAVAAPASPPKQTRAAQEIDLEEEMKRLLGELDLDGPGEQRKA